MARGRRPKPVEQRLREGTLRKDRHPEPMLVAGRPELNELREPPAHLAQVAREFWSTYVVELVECGIVDRVDVPLLEMMATQYARAVQAGRVLAETGHFSAGCTGQLREHPAVRIERDSTAMFERLAQSFGIGPLGRVRLGMAELHRRVLSDELEQAFGGPSLTPIEELGVIDGEAVEDEGA